MNLALSTTWTIQESTLKKLLLKIEGEFNEFKELEKKYKIIAPIEEIQHLETEQVTISEKYKNIVFNKEDIASRYHDMPKDIKLYSAVVAELGRSYQNLKARRNPEQINSLVLKLNQVTASFQDKFDARAFYKLIVE